MDAGTPLCLYDGVRVTSKKRIEKYLKKQKKNDYLWSGVHRGCTYQLFDASDPNSCYGRYANDALSHLNNAEIQFRDSFSSASKVYVIATRRIYVGEEILVPYGEEYWEEKERTHPALFRKAIQYYSPEKAVVLEPEPEPKPVVPEPMVLEQVPTPITKRTREELLEDYYKKKKLLEKLQTEVLAIELLLG